MYTLVHKIASFQLEEKPPPFPVFSVTFREPDVISVVHAADNVHVMMTNVLNTLRPG